MRHFRMKLHGPHPLAFIRDCRDGVAGACDDFEARRERLGVVAVRHPHVQRCRQPMEQRRLRQYFYLRMTVLPCTRRNDPATEVMRHELQAIADAQQRQPSRQHRGVGLRRRGVIYAGRSARKNDSAGLQRHYLGQRRGAGQHHREHVELTDTSRDELRVLRSEIENDDGGRTVRVSGAHKSSLSARGEATANRSAKTEPPPG